MSTCISSGNITSSQIIYTGRGLLRGILMTVGGTDQGQVRVYDGEDNTGELLGVVRSDASQNKLATVQFNTPVRCNKGLYVEVQGSPSRAVVYYGG